MGVKVITFFSEAMKFVRKRFVFFVALLFLLPSCFLKAHFQTVEVKPSAKVEVENGNYFFMHTVLPGQTLYSISRAYTVTQEMIIDHNPELEYGLKSNQVIQIPAFTHHVVAGDTEYNLSRRYGLTIDQLRVFNPALSDGLKLGQQLILPGRLPDDSAQVDQDTDDESSPERVRLPVWPKDAAPRPIESDYPSDADTVRDSLQHDSTIRNLYGAITPCMQATPKETYHVALLIPLFLDDLPPSIHLDSLHAGIFEGLSLRHRSFSFLPYYKGVLIALDSIQKQGVDIRLHVFDVDQNELKARQAVSSPGFSGMDLIIGPFYSNTLNYVCNYALHNNINVVSPLLPDKQKLRGYPNLFNVIPSLDIQLKGLAQYIGENYPESNIVVVHNNQPQALPVINGFKRSLSVSLGSQENSQPQLIQTDWRNDGDDTPEDDDTTKNGYHGFNEVVYERVGIRGLLSKLAENKDNIIVTLISGEAFLSNYLRELSIHSGKYAIKVFGIPDWKDYESIEIDYLQNLHVHIFSPYFIDYSEQHIKDFIRRYRNEFKTEPSSDAFMAVSTAYYFFSALAIYGSSFSDCMEQLNKLPADFAFHFQRPYGTDNGWENDFTTLFKYKDFRLVDVKKESP
jgi:LysM repeat protein